MTYAPGTCCPLITIVCGIRLPPVKTCEKPSDPHNTSANSAVIPIKSVLFIKSSCFSLLPLLDNGVKRTLLKDVRGSCSVWLASRQLGPLCDSGRSQCIAGVPAVYGNSLADGEVFEVDVFRPVLNDSLASDHDCVLVWIRCGAV